MSESSSLPPGSKREAVASANGKRRLRHRFHAARKHHFRFVGLNHLRRADNRLHARAAEPVHGQCRSFDRQARAQPNMPRSIERVARGLLRVAEDDVIEVFGLDSRALNRCRRRDRTEFLRRIVFDFSAIAAKGRARPTDNGNVSGFQHEVLLG